MSGETYPRPYASYLLLERLGQGGMSEVELARRTVDDARFVRFVVIKRIHPEHTDDASFVRMFQDEARINAELQHENIAQVYDFGREGDEFFLAMEYVPGMDLRAVQRRLAERGQLLPLRVSLRVLIDILAALHYAHHRVDTYGRPMNIVHRDVNPRNVMLSVRGEVKLIDFGVAKADTKADKTVGHAIKGKFAYMAPEQIEASQPVDGRADIFAVGLVMHELLEGSSPFAGLTEVQIMHRVLSGQIPPLRYAGGHPDPACLQEIHRRSLAHDREDRYPDAETMRRALLAAAERVGGPADRHEMAQFVRSVDPERLDALAGRLQNYREIDVQAITAAIRDAPVPGAVTGEQSVSRTLATDHGTAHVAGLLGALGAFVGIVGLIGLVGIGAWWWTHRSVEPTPASESVAITSRTPEPVRATPPATASSSEPAKPELAPSSEPAMREPAASPTRPKSTSRRHESTRTTAPALPPAASATRERSEPAGETPAAPEPATSAPSARSLASSPSQEVASTAPEPAPTQPAAPEPAAAEVAPAPEAGPKGYLYVTVRRNGNFEVLVDGRQVGKAPLRAYAVAVGTHLVEVRDLSSGQSWSKKITVHQGRPASFIAGGSH